MEFYESTRCCYGGCDQHPSTHNGGINHCVDCNDEDELTFSHGIKINYVSCDGAKCRYSLDHWDRTPLYCIECYGPEESDEDLQNYIKERTEAYGPEERDEDL
jgi:hypothetical protein